VQASPDRCPRCRFPPELCLCAEIPRLVTPFRFVVVRHASERERLSNTARWAALALEGATVLDHGLPGVDLDAATLAAPGAVALFPSPHPAVSLRERPRLVVVPDGTWSQARRMMQRVPALRTLPRLSLPGPPAGLRLRRPHRGDGMSTLEAIAGALAALGEPAAAERLLRLHAIAVERVLRLKGVWEAGCAEAAHGQARRV
jgi:DTW domain-containing protein YfiP